MKRIYITDPARRGFLGAAGAAAAAIAFGGLPLAARGASKTKIGIIGSGRIGGTLGGLWAAAGHEVSRQGP